MSVCAIFAEWLLVGKASLHFDYFLYCVDGCIEWQEDGEVADDAAEGDDSSAKKTDRPSSKKNKKKGKK